MASSIAKRQEGLVAQVFGDIAGNTGMLNQSQVEKYLDNLCADLNAGLDGKVDSVAAADASVSVTGGKSAVVGVAISAVAGNLLSLADDGLKVIAPAAAEYSVTKLSAASEGASASYQLTKDGVGVGAVIDIPKDMVVSSGTVVTKAEAGAWGEAGTYIELKLANAAEDTLYINVGSLIEYVTSGSAAGDKVVISVDADHKVTAAITAGAITATELADSVNEDIAKGVSAKTAIDGVLAGASSLTTFAAVEAELAKKALASDLETLDGEVEALDAAAVKTIKLNGATLSMTNGLVDLGSIATSESLGQVGDRLEALETSKFTEAERAKLAGIAEGAQVNVQSDWNATEGDAFIKNKPTLGALAAKDEVALADLASDVTAKFSGIEGKLTAAAAVALPTEDAVTLRSLRAAVASLQAALA